MLRRTGQVFRVQLNQIDNKDLENQQKLIVRRKQQMDSAYQQISQLELLPRVSEDIAAALDAILSLQELFQEKWIRSHPSG